MLTPRLGIFGEAEYDTHENWFYQADASDSFFQSLFATALWESAQGSPSAFNAEATH